jgi:hypothetical protein
VENDVDHVKAHRVQAPCHLIIPSENSQKGVSELSNVGIEEHAVFPILLSLSFFFLLKIEV